MTGRMALALLVVIAIVGAVAAGQVANRRLHDPFQAWSGDETFVEIPPGTSSRAIGDRLVAAGVVRDALTFRLALWWTGKARDLRAGEYRFDQARSPLDVVDVLARGQVFQRTITFPEGLTIDEMAEVYGDSGFGAAADFAAAARDRSLIADLDPAARDLEGYLFPDTYAQPRNTPAGALVAQMVALFRQTWTPELQAAAGAQGLTVRDVVTLASLVEKETSRAEERPVVAAVYLNRRRIGMPMQADPTVIYALQRAGRFDGNLRRDDLQFDSPYNTYRYPGLPPGPIAAPSRASIEAMVRPADVDYLYFVSRNDGSHVFARTLAEHNRNVRQWQVQFFRKRR
jgi:UPF0755 protein